MTVICTDPTHTNRNADGYCRDCILETGRLRAEDDPKPQCVGCGAGINGVHTRDCPDAALLHAPKPEPCDTSMTDHMHRYGHLPSEELGHADAMAEVGIPHVNDPTDTFEDPTTPDRRDVQCDGCGMWDGHRDGCTSNRPLPDIEDPTVTPGVEQLPAVISRFTTPAEFKDWLNSAGDMFVVYLPAGQSFIIKVPDAHHNFFVSVMQQVKFCLGDDVKAVRMQVMTGAPADVDDYAPGADPAQYEQFANPKAPE
jgi:hypothetical protein